MPDDDVIENMNPFLKMWMFNNWVEDHNEQIELLKHTGYLIGSFIDPKAARELAEKKGITVDEEVFKETFEEIKEYNKKALEEEQGRVRKRKRKKIG